MTDRSLARRTITATLMVLAASVVAIALLEGLTRLFFAAFDP